ncbi:hypothetical protein B0E50_06065 [Rhodanobacter sp. C01]|nr:hypothetical protein B0E50_06065 [Rhodanobacter sp. C01]
MAALHAAMREAVLTTGPGNVSGIMSGKVSGKILGNGVRDNLQAPAWRLKLSLARLWPNTQLQLWLKPGSGSHAVAA